MPTQNTPADYVETQRKYNFLHNDGRAEKIEEGACKNAIAFYKWVKTTGLPFESVLDAGCRLGYAMDAFIECDPSIEVQGVDIVPEFVEIANRRARTTCADFCAMPFTDDQFDWVFCVGSIEHSPTPDLALKEMMRVAKVGVFVITDIETEASFALNKSHNTFHPDPLGWIDHLRGHGRLVYLRSPHGGIIEMVWLHENWLKEVYFIKGDRM